MIHVAVDKVEEYATTASKPANEEVFTQAEWTTKAANETDEEWVLAALDEHAIRTSKSSNGEVITQAEGTTKARNLTDGEVVLVHWRSMLLLYQTWW